MQPGMQLRGRPEPEAVRDSAFSRFLFGHPLTAPLWLILRVLVGWQWLTSGWEKVTGSGWVGSGAGSAVTKFLHSALQKTGGDMPDVQPWFARFIETVVLPHAALFSYLVSFGELAVGVALILGLLTGVAAFFGLLMNLVYLWAGTLSTNPTLLAAAVPLILAWRVAGWWGLDRIVLPRLWGLRPQGTRPSGNA